MLKKFSLYVSLCLALAPFASSAEDLLSKDDASRLFNTPFSEWKQQVIAAHASGAARGLVAPDGTLTLIAKTPSGTLKVSPIYTATSDVKPQRIAVSVEQTPAISKVTSSLSDSNLLEIIDKTRQQMLPEFTVFTKIDVIDGIAQYDFFIFEIGTLPELDALAVTKKGCWQDCINR